MVKKNQTVKIGERNFEVIGRNNLSPRIFEALAARSGTIMSSLDAAWLDSFRAKDKDKTERPTYKHTVFLGRDDDGRNLRASIAVFNGGVNIQTLREVS